MALDCFFADVKRLVNFFISLTLLDFLLNPMRPIRQEPRRRMVGGSGMAVGAEPKLRLSMLAALVGLIPPLYITLAIVSPPGARM